ncbi:MAG: phage holin family protein [Elusimicrobia bacterium]|nr:phage holin family protein [Elusimicrobiota bacterium]
MVRLLATWLVSALVMIAVAQLVPGFQVADFKAALTAAVVVGLVNATLGLFLKILTLPLTVLTLGLFWWVINAAMLKLSAGLVPGFEVAGLLPAMGAALLLSLAHVILKLALD